jgi:glycosyltransferase involved in cell wall biosynthesis
MKNPLVSVITPVFNGEKYLSECIESVLHQTYVNIEYIIVDNQSNDSSPEIISRFQKQNKRISTYTTPRFLSAVENWNYCLTKVSPQAKYIKYVHADDFIFPECIEKMVEIGESNPHVAVVSSYKLENTPNTLKAYSISNTGLNYNRQVFEGKDIIRKALFSQFYFGSPTSLLYRKSAIKTDAFYDTAIPFHADDDACYKLLLDHDFGFVHQVLSFTRRHKQAITEVARNKKTNLFDVLQFIIKYGKVVLSNGEYEALLKNRMENYHKQLAAFILRFQKDNYKYHADKLRAVGIQIKKIKLLKNIFVLLQRGICNAEIRQEYFASIKMSRPVKQVGAGNG